MLPKILAAKLNQKIESMGNNTFLQKPFVSRPPAAGVKHDLKTNSGG